MSLLAHDWRGWVFPLPLLGGRKPVISDGFDGDNELDDQHRQHLGVDVMYRRLPTEPATLPRGSRLFYMPSGTPVLAAFGGKVWATANTGYGLSVTIDHGNVPGVGPCVTFYQHMSKLSRAWRKGDVVLAGQELGTVGGSRTGYPLHHLHFELWLPTRDRAIDPGPHMPKWTKVPAPLSMQTLLLLLGLIAALTMF